MLPMPKLTPLTNTVVLLISLATISVNYPQIHSANFNDYEVTSACDAHCQHHHHQPQPWRHDVRPYWQPWYDNPRYYWPGFNASVMAGTGATGGCYSQWERDHLNGWVKTRYCY